MRTLWLVIVTIVALGGCGGSEKRSAAPAPDGESDSGGGSGSDDVLIPDEKYEEIKSVFERKTSMLSRCYVVGVEAGQIDKEAKGFITVGVTVTTGGGASGVKILRTSFKSPALEDCVKEQVSGWEFTDSLPKPLETSHTYVLDRF